MMSMAISMAAAQRVMPTMKQTPAINIVALLPIFLQVWPVLKILNAFHTQLNGHWAMPKYRCIRRAYTLQRSVGGLQSQLHV